MRTKILALFVPLLALAACATPPTNPAARAQFEANHDPLEPLNRKVFAFDMFLDKWVIKPLALGYETVIPPFGRNAIHNFLGNLHEPVIFANDMLQTQFKVAGITVGRFVINSTVGVGGIFDVASKWGLEQQSGDFGQTLYHYGFTWAPYLVLPVLGPSNPRDLLGTIADGYADPFSYLAYDYGADVATYGRMGAEGIDERADNIQNLDEVQRTAIDFYAEIRSLYQQHRASELRHGAPGPSPAELNSLYQDPDSGAAATPAPSSSSATPANSPALPSSH